MFQSTPPVSGRRCRLEEVFSEDNMEKIMGPMFKALMEQMQPELTQALQQKSLPLDGEASREDA